VTWKPVKRKELDRTNDGSLLRSAALKLEGGGGDSSEAEPPVTSSLSKAIRAARTLSTPAGMLAAEGTAKAKSEDDDSLHRSVTVASVHGTLLFGPSSTSEDLRHVARLMKETGYSRRELYAMFMQFKALVAMSRSVEGIDREVFLDGVPMLALEDRAFAERVFELLDEDGSGIIEWEEYLTALTKLRHGTAATKASFLFDVYDNDGGGTIDHDEMLHYFLASLRVDPSTVSEYFLDTCKFFVNKVLQDIDSEHHDQLDRSKIVRFLQKHPEVTRVGGLFGRSNIEDSSTTDVLLRLDVDLSSLLEEEGAHFPPSWVQAVRDEEARKKAVRARVFRQAERWRRLKEETAVKKRTVPATDTTDTV
jgi:Ca2+-binding EF-hand superfamily protein